jgi:hypothetical protein
MARKEETISETLGITRNKIRGTSRRIRESAEELKTLEQFLPKREEVILLYRLRIKDILMNCDYLASADDKSQEV